MNEQHRVVLDARKLGDAGIGVYIENMLEGFLALQQREYSPFVFSLLVHPKLKNPRTPQEDGARKLLDRWGARVEVAYETAGNYSLAEYFLLTRRQRELLSGAALYHSPHYILPYGLKIPSVVTIHDAIHVNYPETVLHRPIATRLIRSAVARANHVITVSGASLARIVHLVGSTSTPFTVVPNALRRGIGPLPAAAVSQFLGERNLPVPYLLFVGSDRRHKGFSELLGAWRELERNRKGKGAVPTLVAVGRRFSKRRASDFGVDNRVRFFGETSRSELNFLYNGASAVIVPSFEEGFGLVALEALACGVPLICSPEASLRELAGNAAWYADDFTPTALAQAVLGCAKNWELREAKIAEGRSRAADFEREEVARQTLAVYREVLRGRVPESETLLSYGRTDIFDHHLRRAL